MSETYVSAELRRRVASRANHLCEYCLIHERDTLLGCQIDHIISEKHCGPTELDNLAYACLFCNRNKGSDVGPIILPSREFSRFYDPRQDFWSHHFSLMGDKIVPVTLIGSVTERILGLNNEDRLLERRLLASIGRYPSAEAQWRLIP